MYWIWWRDSTAKGAKNNTSPNIIHCTFTVVPHLEGGTRPWSRPGSRSPPPCRYTGHGTIASSPSAPTHRTWNSRSRTSNCQPPSHLQQGAQPSVLMSQNWRINLFQRFNHNYAMSRNPYLGSRECCRFRSDSACRHRADHPAQAGESCKSAHVSGSHRYRRPSTCSNSSRRTNRHQRDLEGKRHQVNVNKNHRQKLHCLSCCSVDFSPAQALVLSPPPGNWPGLDFTLGNGSQINNFRLSTLLVFSYLRKLCSGSLAKSWKRIVRGNVCCHYGERSTMGRYLCMGER